MTTDSSNPESDEPDDDWDLDDNELTLGKSLTPTPRKAVSKKERDAGSEAKVERMKTPDQTLGTVGKKPGSSTEEVPVEEPEPERDASPEPKHKTSGLEKLSVLTVVLIILGFFAWGISSFLKEAPEGDLVEFTEDFPVKGANVTVEAVETWWRGPVRSGENIDVGVVIAAQLIPCARITIGEAQSTVIQVSFRDGEGNLIGDTINLTVTDGIFARSGESEVTIHGTDGFENASDINPYVNHDIPPWSIVIVDSEDPDNRLVKARVSAERKEND